MRATQRRSARPRAHERTHPHGLWSLLHCIRIPPIYPASHSTARRGPAAQAQMDTLGTEAGGVVILVFMRG
jgi:hypothetical protein